MLETLLCRRVWTPLRVTAALSGPRLIWKKLRQSRKLLCFLLWKKYICIFMRFCKSLPLPRRLCFQHQFVGPSVLLCTSTFMNLNKFSWNLQGLLGCHKKQNQFWWWFIIISARAAACHDLEQKEMETLNSAFVLPLSVHSYVMRVKTTELKKTDPWGIPRLAKTERDVIQPTKCFLSVRKSQIQLEF